MNAKNCCKPQNFEKKSEGHFGFPKKKKRRVLRANCLLRFCAANTVRQTLEVVKLSKTYYDDSIFCEDKNDIFSTCSYANEIIFLRKNTSAYFL